MSTVEALLEAERRGLLPPDKAAALAEARTRGLIPNAVPAQRSGASAQLESKVPDYRKVFASPLAGGEQTGLSRFARGTQDFIDRGVQLSIGAGEKLGLLEPGIGDYATAQMKAEQDAYEARRQEDAKAAGKENAGFDLARMAGGVAPLAPLGAIGGGVTTAARAGYGAIQGAIAGGLSFDPSNSVLGTAKNVLVGGGLGAVAGPVAGYLGDKIGAGVNYLAGRVRGALPSARAAAQPAQILQQVPGIAALPPAQQADLITEAAAQIRQTGTLNAVALERKANLLANLGDTGRVTKSMVTRNPQDFALERNLSKLTGPDPELNRIAGELTDTYAANDAALTGKLKGFSANLPQGTQEALGQNALQSIDDLSKATQKDVTNFYETVRTTVGDGEIVNANKIVSTLKDRGLRFNPRSKPLIEAVREYARDMGLIDADGNAARAISVKDAESLRQFVNTLDDTFGRKNLIKAIDEDVISAAGSDAFAGARAEAAKRFALLDNPATQRALNAFGELQQGKTAQNFIKSQIIDGAEQDVDALLKTLGTQPGAVDSLQSGVLQHLEARAINPNSGQFSGANLNEALQQIGEGKLTKIFGADRTKELISLSRAAIDATYQPAYAAVNSSNSATALLSFIRRGRQLVGVNVPGLNEAAEQAAARAAYRNQLQKTFDAKSTPRIDSQAGKAIGAAIGAAGGPVAPSAVEELRKRAQGR